MNEHARTFIMQLIHLREQDRRAIAVLRRSLSFPPGKYPPAYPYVERYVGAERHEADPFRLALYLVAGLFALDLGSDWMLLASCGTPGTLSNNSGYNGTVGATTPDTADAVCTLRRLPPSTTSCGEVSCCSSSPGAN